MGSLPFESAIGMPDDTEETDVTGFTGIKNSWVPDIKLFIKTFIKKKENVKAKNLLYIHRTKNIHT